MTKRKTTALEKVGIGVLTVAVAGAAFIAFAWYQVTEALSKIDLDNLNL